MIKKTTKLKRNTAPARLVAAKPKGAKREAKKWEIIEVMCPDFCNPDNEGCCRESSPPNSVMLLGCLSQRSIADHLNHAGIETLRGKTGSWQATLVGNVFKEELKQLQQSKTAELPNSGHDSQTGITW